MRSTKAALPETMTSTDESGGVRELRGEITSTVARVGSGAAAEPRHRDKRDEDDERDEHTATETRRGRFSSRSTA